MDIKKYQSVALYDDPGRNVDLAVTAAVTIWDTICEPYLQGQIKKLPSALLVQQEMAWAAISMVVETSKDQRFIEIKDIRLKLSKIRAWKIGVDPKRPAKATEPSSGKRMRTEAADEDQDILAKMQLSPEEQQELRSLTLAIPRPSGAIDSTPEDTIPTQADMESLLAPETELYDSVIFCYLVLVCHKANGHIAGLSTPQRIAPKWYVWDANASQNINNESETFWPPRHYPTAQIDELNILLFPMCLESTLRIGHWVMVVVEKMGHAWQHRLISSLPGFVAKAEIIWTPIARWLKNRHGIQVEESLSSVYDVTHLLPRTGMKPPPLLPPILPPFSLATLPFCQPSLGRSIIECFL